MLPPELFKCPDKTDFETTFFLVSVLKRLIGLNTSVYDDSDTVTGYCLRQQVRTVRNDTVPIQLAQR